MEMSEQLEKIFGQHEAKREAMIPVLQEIQGELGYLPPEAMRAAARFCRVAPVEVFGAATFYAQFKFKPVGRHRVVVCQGTACHVMGGARVLEEMQTRLGVKPGDTTPDNMFTLETVACIGACALAPVMVIDRHTHGKVKTEKIAEILNEARKI